MKKVLSLVGTGICLLLAGTAWAHHSFAAEYDQTKPVTLHGTLKLVELTNPWPGKSKPVPPTRSFEAV